MVHHGGNIQVLDRSGVDGYAKELSNSLSVIGSRACNYDVRFHCLDQALVQSNRQLLANASPLFHSVLSIDCSCAAHLQLSYDFICPDFDPKAMKKVIELVTQGQTVMNVNDEDLLTEIRSIVKCLNINIPLADVNQLAHLAPVETYNFHVEKKPIQTVVSKNRLTGLPEGKLGYAKVSKPSNYQQDSSSLRQPDVVKPVDPVPIVLGCKYCNLNFSNRSELLEHAENHLSTSETDPYSNQDSSSYDANLLNSFKMEFSEDAQPTDQQSSSSARRKRGMLNETEFQAYPSTSEGLNEDYDTDTSNQNVVECNNQLQQQPIYQCQYCNEEFWDIHEFDFHVESHGDSARTLEEGNEEMEIQELSGGNHVEKKTPGMNKGYRCTYCNTTYKYYRMLVTHLATKHLKEKLDDYFDTSRGDCEICGKEFGSQFFYINHMTLVHRVIDAILPSEESVRVEVSPEDSLHWTPKRSKRETEYTGTMTYNPGDASSTDDDKKKAFVCKICSKAFKSKSQRVVHSGNAHFRAKLKAMNGDQWQQCNFCSNKFSSIQSMLYHLIKTHNALKI